MKRIIAASLATALFAGIALPAGAGHVVNHYPSYYPHEILIETLGPEQAARGLTDKTLHAYIGGVPDFAGNRPDHAKSVESLGSFLVLDFNTARPRFSTAEGRCDAARGILAQLANTHAGFHFHPHPVTPYHEDYLHHLDRIEDAIVAVNASTAGGPAARPPLRFRARGRLAEAIVRSAWTPAAGDWDVSLEEVPVETLLAPVRVRFNGWIGPPWLKEGWFQAYRLLASAAADAPAARPADGLFQRLIHHDYRDLTERMNLERQLLESLTRDCRRVVAGYTAKREYYNDEYSDGVENIAFDAQTGLDSPIFVRTVKLKDYPWNGSLHIGVDDVFGAAWNPVAGFTDPPGDLMWSALADPALLAFPFNASWIPNRFDFRITAPAGQSAGVKVPADAVRPEPGTGRLVPVGERVFASAKVGYDILASPFHDGTEMGMADLLYPFVVAYRWGAKVGTDDAAFDPGVAVALTNIQDHLVGIKAIRVDEQVKIIAPGFDIIQKIPMLEVYLRDPPGDEQQITALAPPWSATPWHLLALMEAAVEKGLAAFSEAGARRRGVPWLDLVRDRSLIGKLKVMTRKFARDGYRPDALKSLVTAEQASERWRALAKFADATGHFMVLNGPYRLKAWKAGSMVLSAVREVSYPLGFGTFDRFVNPPRAAIVNVTRDGHRILVSADEEHMAKIERHYEPHREPLTRHSSRGLFGLLVISRYLLIGPDGTVLDVDKMRWRPDGRFAIDLPEDLPPGRYTVLLAVFLDGNKTLPSAKVLRFQVGPAANGG